MRKIKKIDILGTFYITFGERKEKISLPKNHEEIILRLFFQSPFCHPSIAYKKEAIETQKIRHDPDFKIAHDYNLFQKFHKKVIFSNLDKFLLYYRNHPSQITKNTILADKERWSVRKKMFLEYGVHLEEDDFNFFMRALDLKEETLTLDSLRKFESLLNTIYEKLIRSFSKDIVLAECQKQWFRACRYRAQSGNRVLKEFKRSFFYSKGESLSRYIRLHLKAYLSRFRL